MPRQQRSIPLGLVARVAALAVLTGCGDDHRTEAQRCVDGADWAVVADERCDEQQRASGSQTGAGGLGRYHWYYGGSGYNVGERPAGGSTVPNSSLNQVRVNSPAHLGGPSSRGGFGSHGTGAS
jgi:hypothetical protein